MTFCYLLLKEQLAIISSPMNHHLRRLRGQMYSDLPFGRCAASSMAQKVYLARAKRPVLFDVDKSTLHILHDACRKHLADTSRSVHSQVSATARDTYDTFLANVNGWISYLTGKSAYSTPTAACGCGPSVAPVCANRKSCTINGNPCYAPHIATIFTGCSHQSNAI